MNLEKIFPKKRFGQNWLINEKVLEKIKKNADLNANDFILEIGPGLGNLTARLLDSNIKGLHAVELDKDLIRFLENKFLKKENFSLQQGDILSIDLTKSYEFTKVIANIPYNITGPILDLFIGRLGKLPKYNLEKIIFMMQREVADRIIAKEGDSNNSALSTRIKLLSNVKKICDIAPSSFRPSPKVHSSLIIFTPLPLNVRLDIKTEEYIDKLLKITFNARRKKIRNTLNSVFSKENIIYLEKHSEINFNLRPQDISIDQWIKMARICININKSNK
tara:strand:+ start:932 stop:1762 length:831 start_codon:yes stop_codon:yes gene_type:complete